MSSQSLPRFIENLDELENLLSTPSEVATRSMQKLDGDLIIIGAGGKMGPSLARMAKRADTLNGKNRRIYAVSQFSNPEIPPNLQAAGIEVIKGNMLDPQFVSNLPEVPNVINMTGMKFGTTTSPAHTWAVNTLIPTLTCQKFVSSRFVTFSTGNVYPLVDVDSGGALEKDPPGPIGEYAMSALARERIFEYYSLQNEIPMTLLRLNYANELRYGVLVDLAIQVMKGEPVDLSMGYFNIIWQADANSMALSAFSETSSPAKIINIAGPERLSVREVCHHFGKIFNKPAHFTHSEASNALLNNGNHGHKLLGQPRVNAHLLMKWIGHWQLIGGSTLNKPTHFQARTGRF